MIRRRQPEQAIPSLILNFYSITFTTVVPFFAYGLNVFNNIDLDQGI